MRMGLPSWTCSCNAIHVFSCHNEAGERISHSDATPYALLLDGPEEEELYELKRDTVQPRPACCHVT